MIVDPYVRPPAAPLVALLTDDGTVVDETGDQVDLDDMPKGMRVWASYDTVYRLVREGRGEALCWMNEEIRWRHRRLDEDGWTVRPSDANVIRLPDGISAEKTVAALALWRDWLGSVGAAPTGTTGSAAWSLLRATLSRRLVTNSGERPPIDRTVGGRQVTGRQGRFGRAVHVDLPAAYASTLGGLRYGGVWLRADREVRGRRLEDFQVWGREPVFVHADVTVPKQLRFGVLVRRPRGRAVGGFLAGQLLEQEYPVGKRVRGVWTAEEVAAAQTAGCRVRVLGGWIHRSGWEPFSTWWATVQEGRSLGGLAGLLAKMTGNALWGRFAMDTRLTQRRTVRALVDGKLVGRVLPQRPSPFPAHDLAETVSGRVRALLGALLEQESGRVLVAHTDGCWLAGTGGVDGWSVKDDATQVEVVGPQMLRWRGARGGWRYTVSGVPSFMAEDTFARAWEKIQ